MANGQMLHMCFKKSNLASFAIKTYAKTTLQD